MHNVDTERFNLKNLKRCGSQDCQDKVWNKLGHQQGFRKYCVFRVSSIHIREGLFWKSCYLCFGHVQAL